MIRSSIIVLFFSFIFVDAVGQYSHRGHEDVFPNYGNFLRKGWIVSPAFTYMLPPVKSPAQRAFFPGGTAYDIAYKPAGRIGFGLELGRFYLIDKSRIISHVEMNGGLKILRAVENFDAAIDTETSSSGTPLLTGGGSFNHAYVTARFSASNIIQFSKYAFLQNSLGINADYRIAQIVNYSDQNLPIELQDPAPFLFQFNYSLGFGFKMAGNIILTPSVETPILNIYEYNDLKSTLGVFNTRYRPLIFRLNIMVLDRKADRKCPEKPKRKTVEKLFK